MKPKMKQYLVLKTESFVMSGIKINPHKEGCIFLSYNKKKDAEEASENGKYQIIVVESK